MTFEDFLRYQLKLDYCLTIKEVIRADGKLECIIHPLNEDGDTIDFVVSENTITVIDNKLV